MPNISLTTVGSNVVLAKRGHRPTTDEEMLTLHIINLLRSVFDFGAPSNWWKGDRSEAKQDDDDLTDFMIRRPDLFKLCGMTLSRFNKLMSCCTPCTDDDDAIFEDPWAQIRGQVEQFNTTRARVVVPGAHAIHPPCILFIVYSSVILYSFSFHPPCILCSSSAHPLFILYSPSIHPYSSSIRPLFILIGRHLTADESMSAWRGRDGKFDSEGMPHVTKIVRKPKGVGLEIRTLADGRTRIMLFLELQEGKHAMGQLDAANIEKYGANTANLVRMTAAYHSTSRIVCADSAWGSVMTAVTLGQHGLYTHSIVKGSTKRLAVEYLRDPAHYPTAGSSTFVCASIDGLPVLAIGWQDQTRKILITTCGTTADGTPHEKGQTDWVGPGQTSTRTIKVRRPRAFEDYFDNALAIDVNNHLRQGELRVEQGWITRKWYLRVHSTILGMSATDAFLAFHHATEQAVPQTIREFVEKMAAQHFQRVRRNKAPRKRRSLIPVAAHEKCALKPLSEHPDYILNPRAKNGRCQRRCSECTTLCTFYCVVCSVSLCGTSSKRRMECIMAHLEKAR
jgi:hypothetical protein